MNLSGFLSDLLVVIVLFKKKPENALAVSSLQAACNLLPLSPALFLYDNSPDPSPPSDLHITYQHSATNGGVSKAYNDAVVVATKNNKKWMLFLDQDTIVDRTIFDKFFNSMSKTCGAVAFVPEMRDRMGAVSPFKLVFGGGKRIHLREGKYTLAGFRFINSGLLIESAAFKAAGGYEESIPLDFSDIAFGEKLRKITDHFILIDGSLSLSFSGTEKMPLSLAVERFHFFCAGALNMGKKFGPFYIYFNRALLRTMHLCFRYKTLQFLKIFFQHAGHG
jgi:glycosyltransferase involved in cell wall biosynthesis